MSLYPVSAFSLNYTGPIRNLSLITTGYLRYEEREVYNSTAKFGYEEARNGVHIRNLHNNKYLVRETGQDWIVATASEPVEDTTRRDCTLFRLVIATATTMRWVHVNTGITVAMALPSDQLYGYYLTIRSFSTNQVTCTPVDVERLIKLPKIVVFKGDNGRYLQALSDQWPAFQGEDRHRKETWHETFPVNNGDVRIRSVQRSRFWRRDTTSGSIIADSTATTSTDSNTIFQIVRLSDSTIALINRGNNRFCQRLANNGRFNAGIDSGVKEAEMEVEEPIVDRSIEVEYRLRDARIYGEKPRSWLSQVAFNEAKDRDLETTLKITYSESLSFSFNVTTTITTNYTSRTTVSASVPLIAKGTQEFEFSAGLAMETGFGTTVDKSESYEFSAAVIVPPGQKRRAKLMALEAKCDVPFSYIQTEVQADGQLIRTNLQDGVYKGMNGYEFHVQVYDPLEPNTIILDEPVATRYLPDTIAREKIYPKKN